MIQRDSSLTAPSSFAAQVNAATRQEHTTLNRLILARLPLSLPPIASDPSAYLAGIETFSSIFFAFEHEWQNILSKDTTPPRNIDDGARRIDVVSSLLTSLHEPELTRTKRLQSDLRILSSRISHPANNPSLTLIQSIAIQQRCAQTSETIAHSIRQKPHLLLAYSWTMYMALFSGGRWMRQQMLNSGPEFWGTSSTSSPPTDYNFLSLWFFDPSTCDGEELKIAFKARYEEVAAQLTESERMDVIDEAVKLFRMCIDLVDFLDRLMMPSTAGNTIDMRANSSVEAALMPMPPAPSLAYQTLGLTMSARRTPHGGIGNTMFTTCAIVLLVMAIWMLTVPASSTATGELFHSSSTIFTGDW